MSESHATFVFSQKGKRLLHYEEHLFQRNKRRKYGDVYKILWQCERRRDTACAVYLTTDDNGDVIKQVITMPPPSVARRRSKCDIDDDDAVSQNDRASAPPSTFPSTTPRRLCDLPAHRRAVAKAVPPTSQPVASSFQSSQSTICPVCLMVVCDSAIIPCGHCLCCTCLQTISSTATGCARCPVCRTDITDTVRLHFSE